MQIELQLSGMHKGIPRSKVLSYISKKIWDYLLTKGLIITAECLINALDKKADTQSQTVKQSSKRKMDSSVF